MTAMRASLLSSTIISLCVTNTSGDSIFHACRARFRRGLPIDTCPTSRRGCLQVRLDPGTERLTGGRSDEPWSCGHQYLDHRRMSRLAGTPVDRSVWTGQEVLHQDI